MPGNQTAPDFPVLSRNPLSPWGASQHKSLFVSPPPAGRRILFGFTWLQRLSRGAQYDVWFPEKYNDHPSVKWAAIRQFELLQEAGNYKIFSMRATEMERSLLNWSRSMRASGYRVTVITMGDYLDGCAQDDLEIFDKNLQDRIAQLINMLYLEEESEKANSETNFLLAADKWELHTALPHIAMTLGAQSLFKPEKAKRQTQLAKYFFDLLGLIPAKHILHDTAIGLQLPEAIKEHERVYMPDGDLSLGVFNGLLCDLFSPFDGVSLAGLHERDGAGLEIKSTGQHLRHCDQMTEAGAAFYRDMASYVPN